MFAEDEEIEEVREFFPILAKHTTERAQSGVLTVELAVCLRDRRAQRWRRRGPSG
jgi:hypothetical protein|eukprot:COSAG02_NODE_3533_length_6604_cov_5.986472_5_plen_55_part_00